MQFTSVAIALSIVLLQAGNGPRAIGGQQYVICAALYDKPNASPKQKGTVLAEPMLVATANRPVDMNCGGELTLGESKIPFGLSFKVTVTPTEDERVKIAGVLEKSSVGNLDNNVVQRESFGVHFVKTVVLGKTTRIRIRKTPESERWFELTVETPEHVGKCNALTLPVTEPTAVSISRSLSGENQTSPASVVNR